MSGDSPRFSISDLDEKVIRQAAELLVEGFREDWPEAWPDMDAAPGGTRPSERAVSPGSPGRERRGTGLDRRHPLLRRQRVGAAPACRASDLRRRGIGRALADLEERVQERGGLTLWLGTDDESGMTSLSGVDLYPNVLEHLANIENLRGHPYEFYQQLGFDSRGPARRQRTRQAGYLHGQTLPLQPISKLLTSPYPRETPWEFRDKPQAESPEGAC